MQPVAPESAPSSYPPARRSDVVEVHHGIAVADPYRWLEDLDAPETRAWADAQSRLSSTVLGGLRERLGFRERLTAMFAAERMGVPVVRAGRFFFQVWGGGREQQVVYVATALDGERRVLLDPGEISPDGRLALVDWMVSADGRWLGYGLAEGGGDWVEWRIRDVASGTDLPDRLPWTKYYPPTFTRDGGGLFYSRFPEPPAARELVVTDRDSKVYFHELGGAPHDDALVFERPDQPTWQFLPKVTADGVWLVITAGEGQVGDRRTEAVWVLDLRTPEIDPTPLFQGFDAEYLYVTNVGSTFYFRTTAGAPRGSVVAVDTASARVTTVVPEGEWPIESVSRSGDRLLVVRLENVHSRVWAHDLDGVLVGEATLPGLGSVMGLESDAGADETFYGFTGLTTPSTVHRYDLATNASQQVWRPQIPFEPSDHQVTQVFYASRDGTRVPMFVAHRKDLALDGRAPTLLTGYGGYGLSAVPWFASTHACWLERGGVLAVPGLRGGGEYGEEWHHAAIRTRKQATFDDFIAAAEWLIANRYTCPERLAVQGASNGGLLVAACAIQRPELFAAVLAEAGVYDMVRFPLAGQGVGWEGEYGSPEDPEELAALLAYSPVHAPRPGQRFPAMLITTGDHDTRCAPWHSYKLVAALQHAQAGKPPVLLNVVRTAGHGGAVTLPLLIDELAEGYGFLAAAVGL